MRRWLAAVIALVLGAATLVLAVAAAVSEFPRGLGVLGCVVIAGACAWYGVLRRGIARVAGLTVAGLQDASEVATTRPLSTSSRRCTCGSPWTAPRSIASRSPGSCRNERAASTEGNSTATTTSLGSWTVR